MAILCLLYIVGVAKCVRVRQCCTIGVYSVDVGIIRVGKLTDTIMRADDIDISTPLSLPHVAPCAPSLTESVRRV